MKKSKLLALTLTLSIILMGAGYAAWNDTLTITNNLTTGKLDIKFANGSRYPSYHVGYDENQNEIQFITGRAYYNNYLKTATLELNNLYPGAYAYFDLKAINYSTIPVKLDSFEVQYDQRLGEYLLSEVSIMIYEQANSDSAYSRVIGDIITKPIKISDLQKELNNAISTRNSKGEILKNVVIQPGGYITFDKPEDVAKDLNGDGIKEQCIYFKLSDDAPNSLQGITDAKVTIKANFVPFNK